MSTIFFGPHELASVVAVIAAGSSCAQRDALRIYTRIAADYSVYNASAWRVRYDEPIAAALPHDEATIHQARPRVPDLKRAVATAILLAYNLDAFGENAKALSAAHSLVLGTLAALRKHVPGYDG